MTQACVTSSRFRYPWMFGREFDLLFYFAPIAIGIALFLLSQSVLAATQHIWLFLAVNAFGAGPFHWGGTWFTYFDKRNREHYASSSRLRAIYFLGPPLIISICIWGWMNYQWLFFTITLIWAIQHFVQQNIGILLLYHNHNQGEAIVDKKIEKDSQWAPSIFFSLYFAHRVILSGQKYLLIDILLWLSAICALLAVFRYMLSLRHQFQEGKFINVPALGFWLASAFSLAPLAFLGQRSDDGFIIPATMHWLQYIGLNYRLIEKKYSSGESENVSLLPADKPLFLFFSISIFFLVFVFLIAFCSYAIQDKFLLGILGGIGVGLTNTHYWLDAFLWRFREEYQRKTVLPFLVKQRS